MQIPLGPQHLICPLHRKSMAKVCHTCPWWVSLKGKHPQSEEVIDNWQCSIAWLPIVALENAQQARQTGAAVESARNEAKKAHDESMTMRSIAIQRMRDVTENMLPDFPGVPLLGSD